MPFVCPLCGATSHNPHDARERYCGRCHVFVEDEPVASARRLVGRRVRWVHDACGSCGTLVVTRATADGLVELEGWSGQFSPSGFVVVDGSSVAD